MKDKIFLILLGREQQACNYSMFNDSQDAKLKDIAKTQCTNNPEHISIE